MDYFQASLITRGLKSFISFRQILLKLFDPNSECFAKHDAFCSHIFDYACLRRKAYKSLMKRVEITENLYTSKTILKMAGGRMHTHHPTSVSAPGQKLQKPSKGSGSFQSLATIYFVLFTKRQSQKGGGHGPMSPSPKYASDRNHWFGS